MPLKLFFIFVVVFVTSCSAQPLQSRFIGVCKSLLEPQPLWEGRADLYVGNRIITTEEDIEVGIMSTALGTLPVGTQLKVVSILKDSSGSYGEFLRVQMKILSGEHVGLISDIPACVPHHPHPRWITNCTLDPNALVFNEDIVKNCDV